MSDEANRWKEKYLHSIEQQEKLERRWNARLDLLRRGLVRSTLAAEGTDRAVDQCMKEMREVIRTDDMDAGLAALLPRLEKAVLDSEQRRETRVDQIATALAELVKQLQGLPLPREVSRPLKTFAKQLDGRVGQAREIPLLLGELSGLQGRALSLLEQPTEPNRPGLLQRLFGGRELDVEVRDESTPATVTASAPLAPVHQAQEPSTAAGEAAVDADVAILEEPAVEVSVLTPAMTSEMASPAIEPIQEPQETLALAPAMVESRAEHDPERAEQEALYALPDSPEPSYSSVAKHIEGTLLGLLDDLSLPERHRPQAEAMRERLKNGLNWYELLPILDDLAVLMLAITDSGQHEFEAYLQQLNERLESFQSHLQETSEGHADNSSADRDLNTQLREQVDGLQSSVQEAADLDSLKHVLESHLEGLLGTMDEHQQQRDQREQETAARLKGLAERVANMEQEAQGYRDHLEVQRQKALIDPLTGLPNRAAWSERLDHEVNAWHQRGNSLSLAMLDLDHFKRINDGYGHLAGDKVLKIIANVLRKRLRPTDFIARFGGEEFVLLMPNSSLADALAVGEVLRAAIEACPFHFKGEPVTVTVSMGVAQFLPGERSDLALKRADAALYRAKAAGRNQVQAA